MKTYKTSDISVNILGTEYTLHICPDSKDKRFEQLNCDGFCDYSTKELFVSNYKDNLANREISVYDPRYIIRNAIRHEMVHAFLFESGLGCDWEHKTFGHEETTVDWIAKQLEKMHEAYQSVLPKLEDEEL